MHSMLDIQRYLRRQHAPNYWGLTAILWWDCFKTSSGSHYKKIKPDFQKTFDFLAKRML